MAFLKRFARSRLVQTTVGVAAAEYLRLVWNTSRTVLEPADIYERMIPNLPVIIAMWHGQHFMVPFIRRGYPAKVLISRHRDGEINAIAAERLGVGTIRGSGDASGRFDLKGGVGAFQAMLDDAAGGMLGRAHRRRAEGRARRRHRHHQARAAVRPSDPARRGRDQPAQRARQLGSHRHQSSVQPARHGGGRSRHGAGRRRWCYARSQPPGARDAASTGRPRAPTRSPIGRPGEKTVG